MNKEIELLGKAVIVEYRRGGKSVDQLCELLEYVKSDFIKIKNKDGKIFLIPTRQVENIKLLGDVEW